MADSKYTGKGFALTFDGVQFGVADCEFNWSRGVIKQPRAGKESDLQLAGKLSFDFKLTNNYFKGGVLAKLIGNTVNSGPPTDVVLHSGLAAPSSTPNVTVMTNPNAQFGVVKFQALTEPITSPGTAIIYGTNINGNPDAEIVSIPALDVNATVTGNKVWNTVLMVVGKDWVQTGGSLKVLSTAKQSSVAVNRPVYFDISGTATAEDGSHNVSVIARNVFLTKGSLVVGDADKYIPQALEGTIMDADADLIITYVD